MNTSTSLITGVGVCATVAAMSTAPYVGYKVYRAKYQAPRELARYRVNLAHIENQIKTKIEEIDAIPKVEKDNTIYWEGYYGGCKRTSYNTKGGEHRLGGTPFRKNYAGVGYVYDPVRDAFYTEQPYPSWTLDESTCYWQPPTPAPEGRGWYWKEDTTEWVDYYWQEPTSDQPYPSWTYNGISWEAPVPAPNDKRTRWDEESLTWIEY